MIPTPGGAPTARTVTTSTVLRRHAATIGRTICAEIRDAGGWTRCPGVHDTWSFYDGRVGVLFFLAHLCCTSDDDLIRSVTTDGLTLLSRCEGELGARGDCMNGALGAAWTLYAAGTTLGQSRWSDAGQRLLADLPFDRIQTAEMYAGLCGAIVVLLALYRQAGSPDHYAAALRAAKALVDHHLEIGCFGAHLASSQRCLTPLLGAAHGTSGVVIAASELVRDTRQPVFAYVAKSALEYEDSFLSPTDAEQACRWVDGRVHSDLSAASRSRLLQSYEHDRFASDVVLPPAHAFAWCNGKSGFVAARLAARAAMGEGGAWELTGSLTSDEYWRAHEHAIDDYTYCCGHAGVADVYLIAGHILRRPELLRSAEQIGHRCAARWQQLGTWLAPWQIPGRPWNSFMKGLAGIGYLFLRLSAPERFPSPLAPSLSHEPRGPLSDTQSVPSIAALRGRVIERHWGLIVPPSRTANGAGLVASYLQEHAAGTADDDCAGFRSYVGTWIEAQGAAAAGELAVRLEAAGYRLGFERQHRVLLDRWLEHRLFCRPDLLGREDVKVVVQRDARWWPVQDQSAVIVFFVGAGRTKIVRLSGRAMMALLTLSVDGRVEALAHRFDSAAVHMTREEARRETDGCIHELMTSGLLLVDPEWLRGIDA